MEGGKAQWSSAGISIHCNSDISWYLLYNNHLSYQLPFFIHLLDNCQQNPYPWECIEAPDVRMTNLPRSFALGLWLEGSSCVSWQQHMLAISGRMANEITSHKSHAFEKSQEKTEGPLPATCKFDMILRPRSRSVYTLTHMTWLKNHEKTIWRCWVHFLSMQFRDSPVSTWCCEEQAFQTQNGFQLYGCLLSDKIH